MSGNDNSDSKRDHGEVSIDECVRSKEAQAVFKVENLNHCYKSKLEPATLDDG